MAIGDIGRLLSSTSMTRLRGFLEEREDVILSLVGHDLRLAWASALGSAAILRRNPSKISGLLATDLVHNDDVAILEHTLQRALAGETASCNVCASEDEGTPHAVRVIAWPSIDREAALVIAVPTTAAD